MSDVDYYSERDTMFWLAMLFLVLAIMSGALGFAFFIGKVLLFVFLVACILTLMIGRTILG